MLVWPWPDIACAIVTSTAPLPASEALATQAAREGGALRELDEEFAIAPDAVESIKVLSLNVEYLTLSVDIITLIKLNLTAEEIKQGWLLRARHRDEV